MKKIYFAFATITLIISSNVFGQDTTIAYKKGTSTISVGYGFINTWKTLLEYYGQKAYATGPVVLTYEYGISKKISAGLTVGYSKVTDDFTDKFISYLIVASCNYHFLASKKFNPYVGAGFGYYQFNYSNSYGAYIPFSLPTSLAFSIQAGAKYYFSTKFGAYAEAGYVDGAIIQAGLTYKIK